MSRSGAPAKVNADSRVDCTDHSDCASNTGQCAGSYGENGAGARTAIQQEIRERGWNERDREGRRLINVLIEDEWLSRGCRGSRGSSSLSLEEISGGLSLFLSSLGCSYEDASNRSFPLYSCTCDDEDL